MTITCYWITYDDGALRRIAKTAPGDEVVFAQLRPAPVGFPGPVILDEDSAYWGDDGEVTRMRK